MAAVTIEQIGDWTLLDDGWTCKFGLADYRGQVQGQPVLTPRAGTSPSLQQGQISARTMPVTFVWNNTVAANISIALETLAGKLSIDDPSPRRIVGTAVDGTRIQTTAAVALTSGWDENQSMNKVLGSLVAGKTRWEATTTTTVSATLTDVGQYPAIAIPNAGYAAVEPVITITPTLTAHLSTTSTVGWQNRRQCTFTNGGVNTWTNRPLRLDFGDTTVWVTDGARSDGADVRILVDGVSYSRTLIAWNWPQTYCWFIPPAVAPGASITIDVIYNNPSATSAPTLTGKLHPSFIYEYATGTATSGSTTTMTDTGQAWGTSDINWNGGFLRMLTGPNAGFTQTINANTTNSVTVASPFGSANAAGNKYIIYHSRNDRWWFNVQQWFDASSGTPVRGLWYLDKRTSKPGVIDFDVPGSWAPYLMNDNQDRFAQKSVSKISGKYYAILDAYRTWQGGGAKGQIDPEQGIADGVAFHSVLPIAGVETTLSLYNNLNGMAQAQVMAKAAGAEGWEPIYSLATASTSTPATVDTYITLPATGPYYDLYRGLQPSDTEGVIRPDRARDSGNTSADGATRTIVTKASGGPFTLHKDPDSASAAVQTSVPADVTVPISTAVELDGRSQGDWRGVLYTDGSGNQYKGWLSKTNVLTGATAGGDTFIDGAKSWNTNELVGAKVIFTGGPNVNITGKAHFVASNTPTTVTLTGATVATIVQGTAYEISQPPTTVSLQDGLYSWVDFDTTGITITAAGAKQNVYQVAAQLLVGDGGPATFIRRVETDIGISKLIATNSEPVYVFLLTTESLVLDGPNRRASVVDASGNVLRTLTDPAVVVQQVSQDVINRRKVTKRAARWLPMAMGTASTADFEHNTAIDQKNANWTVTALSNDTTGGIYDVVFAVTANTGGTDSTADLLFNIPFAVALGQRVQYIASVRTTNVNLQPRLGVNWYSDAPGTTLISSTYQPQWTPAAANVWYESGFSAINADLSDARINPYDADAPLYFAPNGVVSCKLVVRVVSKSGSQTGTVRVGVRTGNNGPRMGMPILWYRETGGAGLMISTAFPAGYLG